MARTGRPSIITPELSALVGRLAGSRSPVYPDRTAITREVRRRGFAVSRRIVSKILDGGRHLAPGERRLATPKRCKEGHLCEIVPCRTCAMTKHRASLDAQREMQRKAERLKRAGTKPQRPKRRRSEVGGRKSDRTPPGDCLKPELSPEQAQRLEEIRRQKRQDGEA